MVANGASRRLAYATVYSSGGNANTQRKNAHVLARHPAVAAAIAAYEARLLPIDDIRTEKRKALQCLKELAFSPEASDRIRLTATIKLYEALVQLREEAMPHSQ
jgi:hypothetical protein